MAKITPTSLVAAISGRTCQNDNTHFITNKRTGKVYAAKLCHPADQSNPTEKQAKVRSDFGANSVIAKAWRVANAPSEAQPNGTAEFQAMMRQYKAQHKIGNWFSFVRTKIKDGAIPSFIDGTVTQPSGGGQNSDGGSDLPPAE